MESTLGWYRTDLSILSILPTLSSPSVEGLTGL
jgi:hypothetical protein